MTAGIVSSVSSAALFLWMEHFCPGFWCCLWAMAECCHSLVGFQTSLMNFWLFFLFASKPNFQESIKQGLNKFKFPANTAFSFRFLLPQDKNPIILIWPENLSPALLSSRSRMEHSCSLLLLCGSFIFAQALPPNGTELPKTTTTTSKDGIYGGRMGMDCTGRFPRMFL